VATNSVAAGLILPATMPFLDRLNQQADGQDMATETKLTWEQMKKMYPNQYLEIVDFETDKFVASGVVLAHGKSISDFPPPPLDRSMIAIEYMGESTYRL
jgi:hypothetical protein